MLVGGRVTGEDAYAYSKFARIVLQTNDIDFRARPHSVEEAEFLASNVVATGPDGGSVTYAEIEAATTVLLVGFEPEDESPIVFLRLRKAVRKTRTAVFAVAPLASRGLEKLGHGDQCRARAPRPRCSTRWRGPTGGDQTATTSLRAAAAAGRRDPRGRAARDGPRRVVRCRGAGVVHRRQAGLDSPARRRAGRARRRPAAGPCCPAVVRSPLCGCTTVGWTGVPTTTRPGPHRDHRSRAIRRHRRACRRRRRPRRLARPAGGDRRVGDRAVPGQPRAARERGDGSRRCRPPRCAGRREGRQLRQLGGPGPAVRGDARRHRRADRRPRAARARRGDGRRPRPARCRRGARRDRTDPVARRGRRRRPAYDAVGRRAAQPGQAVLATWHLLLDAGRLQDGEPHLAGTAKKATAVLSASTAAEVGVARRSARAGEQRARLDHGAGCDRRPARPGRVAADQLGGLRRSP